jgi:hypothetical protein
VAEEGTQIRLTAPSAGITVRKDDWRVVAGFVILADHEYRFTETGFELVRPELSPWVETAHTASIGTPKRTVSPDTVAPPAINLDELELDCRYALHQAGADVGYPIEIRTQTGDASGLVLSGLVPTGERRQEIERALAGLPFVRIALKTEQEAALEALPPVREHAEIRVASERSPIEEGLRLKLGEPAAVQRFTRETLAANDRLMSHAWAIRRLTTRYPAAAITRFGPAARRKFDEINLDHRRAMLEALRVLTALLEPVLEPLANAPRAADSSDSVFELAQIVEQWTLALLSGSGPNAAAARSSPDSAARELLDALSRLHKRLSPG